VAEVLNQVSWLHLPPITLSLLVRVVQAALKVEMEILARVVAIVFLILSHQQANQGFAGASGFGASFSGDTYSGAGGGAGEAGNTDGAREGGDGITCSIDSVARGGGGGGTGRVGYIGGGSGGTGGGAAGGSTNVAGAAGTVNTGGGGGGTAGGDNPRGGGAGGSGIVVLKYPDSRTITIGAGLTGSTATAGGFSTTTITAGTGNVSWA